MVDNGIEKHKFYRWQETTTKKTKMIDIIFILSEDWNSDPSVGQYRSIELGDINGESELRPGMTYSYKWRPERKKYYKITEITFGDLDDEQKIVFWNTMFNDDTIVKFYFDE